ncbi:MAG: prenyltransferase [Deltaproteobacteria bacterium]|nr:prenyltransferase [Deltaproteobacteria bacterium]
MKLSFLTLTPACVVLGVATAAFSGFSINLYHVVLILAGALCAHISVNALNEYYDFKSGLDLITRPTPFSGGSGALPANPDKAHYALITGVLTLIITAAIGIYFLYVRGIWLLPLGLVGIITVAAYTTVFTKNPVVCLIVPGLGFGPLMVMGTDFALTGSYSWISFTASLVPFFLVSDLLLLNQFPDVEADTAVGRWHLPIVIGRKASAKVYTIILLAAYVPILAGYVSGIFPLASLLGLATLLIAAATIKGVVRYADDIPGLLPYMTRNVVINISTPILLAAGLFLQQG